MAKTHTTPANMTVKIVVNDKGNPPGRSRLRIEPNDTTRPRSYRRTRSIWSLDERKIVRLHREIFWVAPKDVKKAAALLGV